MHRRYDIGEDGDEFERTYPTEGYELNTKERPGE
jgi:hypothetical protein